jgi:hypothetical protein
MNKSDRKSFIGLCVIAAVLLTSVSVMQTRAPKCRVDDYRSAVRAIRPSASEPLQQTSLCPPTYSE